MFDAAIQRIERLFHEFENVVVAFSGGKDSTIIFELCLIVARKLNRLPLTVMFIDQEAEWASTIEMIEYVMYHKDVTPKWYQMPIVLNNATSDKENYLHCWNPKEKELWLRDENPISIKENIYDCKDFLILFDAIMKIEYPDKPACLVGGIRTDESPARMQGLTSGLTYKDITWGKQLKTGRVKHYTFYPIYDWGFSDVWAAIFKNGWKYSTHYDTLHQLGISRREMRVSNVHHETAINSIWIMQEIEPKLYSKLTTRLKGIDMADKFGADNYYVRNLPSMFSNWRQYRDHLLEKLITKKEWIYIFKTVFSNHDQHYEVFKDFLVKLHVQTILSNDWELTKLKNFMIKPLPDLQQRLERPKLIAGMAYDKNIYREIKNAQT